MIVFPAVDILQGRAVRLLRGDYNKVTDYGTPVERALMWAEQGAEYLHIVDLNGAKTGTGSNLPIIRDIVKQTKIKVQTGGGVRTLDDIKARLDAGVERVILGTVCCRDPELVARAVSDFGGERIVCGIDAKDGKVAVEGWTQGSQIDPYELGGRMRAAGVIYTVFTDISRDGALTGVNVQACADMQSKTSLRVVASGGVSSHEDITALAAKNIYGVILGKALYEGKVDLKQITNYNVQITNADKK